MTGTSRKSPKRATQNEASSRSRRRSRWVTVIAVSLLVIFALSVGTSGPADARPRFFPIPNATADTAVLTPTEDNDVVVTGGIKCAEGQLVEIDVTVTQESTDAVAKGSTLTRCLGTDKQPRWWAVHAPTLSQASFETGNAHVVVNARTLANGKQTHEWSWEPDVQLIRYYTDERTGILGLGFGLAEVGVAGIVVVALLVAAFFVGRRRS